MHTVNNLRKNHPRFPLLSSLHFSCKGLTQAWHSPSWLTWSCCCCCCCPEDVRGSVCLKWVRTDKLSNGKQQHFPLFPSLLKQSFSHPPPPPLFKGLYLKSHRVMSVTVKIPVIILIMVVVVIMMITMMIRATMMLIKVMTCSLLMQYYIISWQMHHWPLSQAHVDQLNNSRRLFPGPLQPAAISCVLVTELKCYSFWILHGEIYL